MTNTQTTTATTAVTIGRETRTVELTVSTDGRRATAPSGTFVGSIGAGRATYPANPIFTPGADGTWKMGGVVIRNRQGRVTGFADTRPVTNHADQTRA